jgi:hypothetical protein
MKVKENTRQVDSRQMELSGKSTTLDPLPMWAIENPPKISQAKN